MVQATRGRRGFLKHVGAMRQPAHHAEGSEPADLPDHADLPRAMHATERRNRLKV
jgi:hypothetical protein